MNIGSILFSILPSKEMNTNLPSLPNSRVEYSGEAMTVRRLLTHTKKLHEILRRKRKLQFSCSFHMHRLQEGFIISCWF